MGNRFNMRSVKDKKIFSVLQSIPCRLKTIEKRIDEIVIGSGIQSIVPGVNINVDDTDPLNPIISTTSSGSGLTLGDEVTGSTYNKLLGTDDDGEVREIGTDTTGITSEWGYNDLDSSSYFSIRTSQDTDRGLDILNNPSTNSVLAVLTGSDSELGTDSIIGSLDMSPFFENPMHTNGIYCSSTKYNPLDEDEVYQEGVFITLFDLQYMQLVDEVNETSQGYQSSLVSGFTSLFFSDENSAQYWGVSKDGVEYYTEENGILYRMPTESPLIPFESSDIAIGKVITSNADKSTYWSYIGDNRVVVTESLGAFSPSYKFANVFEITALNEATLSLGLPIDMTEGSEIKIRINVTGVTSFSPDPAYKWTAANPADLEIGKIYEITIREFNGNFYANLLVWN